MAMARSFSPVAGPDARVLILGSMPGERSLRAGEYYAHERNAFWRIMGDLLGAGPDLPYACRLEKLKAAGVALWDVIADCERYGSLDSDIVGSSVRANDFSAFFAVHRSIDQVFFNGGAAEAHFVRHVLPGLSGHHLRLARLPSTSPAHAARAYGEKLAAWSVIVAAAK
jgi:double-stranded uracil-DNA glycosylase